MMKFFLFIFFIISLKEASAQNVKELFKLVEQAYNQHETFSVQTKYQLFKGNFRGELVESYGGVILKNQENYYQKVNTTEFIYTNDFSLQISHPEKTMLYLAESKMNLPIFQSDILFKNSTNAVQRSFGNYNSVHFYFEDKISEFKEVVFKIHKQSHRIAQIEYYYAEKINMSKIENKKDFQQPCLRILFSDFTTKPAIESTLFKRETYFSNVKNKLVGTGNYKSYNILNN